MVTHPILHKWKVLQETLLPSTNQRFPLLNPEGIKNPLGFPRLAGFKKNPVGPDLIDTN